MNYLIEMKERILNQTKLEVEEAKQSLFGSELTKKTDKIERFCNFNLMKSENISHEEKNPRFIQFKTYIEESHIEEKDKIDCIVTSATLFEILKEQSESLDDEKLLLLSLGISVVPQEEYDPYGVLLSNPLLLQAILEKTNNIKEQLSMCDEVFEYCDSYGYEQMSKEDYGNSINDLLSLINQYQVGSQVK